MFELILLIKKLYKKKTDEVFLVLWLCNYCVGFFFVLIIFFKIFLIFGSWVLHVSVAPKCELGIW